MNNFQEFIEKTFIQHQTHTLSSDFYESISSTVLEVMTLLDEGKIRVAEPQSSGWVVNEWVKKAILLYFRASKLQTWHSGEFEYIDRIPLKKNFASLGVRVVPPASARFGSYMEKNVILMPSYVNIGAYIGENTMVDTWATVGSCAQIGKNVHLSGGVGIGGVLEPPQASPVIVEDGAFIGSRAIIVEGVHIGKEAVIAANVTLTSSTPIIDLQDAKPIEHRGFVPPRSVVVAGTRPKTINGHTVQLACAYIIGQRKESTNLKTSLNDTLRFFDLSV